MLYLYIFDDFCGKKMLDVVDLQSWINVFVGHTVDWRALQLIFENKNIIVNAFLFKDSYFRFLEDSATITVTLNV